MSETTTIDDDGYLTNIEEATILTLDGEILIDNPTITHIISVDSSNKLKIAYESSSILLIACSAPFFALGTSEEMFLKKSPGSKLIEKIVKERYILEDGV